jgi:hypothetical protein
MSANRQTTSYRNPWHNPHDSRYGPPRFTTDARPIAYRGYLIYHRFESCWDVVKDGVCVTQRAGLNGKGGAKDWIDAKVEGRFML